MSQQLTGGALVFLGATLYVPLVLDLTGVHPTVYSPLFLLYGWLVFFLGAGVYTDQIQFEENEAWRYESTILVAAFFVILTVFVFVLFYSV